MTSRKQLRASTELAFGRYEHRAELGRGASGRVVEVVDHAAGGELRALKIVGAEHAERLAWELEVLGGAAHPSLARVHELLRIETPLGPPFRLPRGAFVLVEDRAPGDVSTDVVAALEPPARSTLARTLAAQLAGALDALHARGLVHGDVKPANVVVQSGAEPRATLVDLGLAVRFGPGGIGGTPRFLAPEALLGVRSPATDVYALGGTLHAWIVGGSGDASRSDAPSTAHHAWSPLPAWVDPDLADLVRRCLDPDPAVRPRSAAEVARALGATDVLTLVGAPSGIERARRAAVIPMVGRSRERERLARAVVETFSAARPRASLLAVHGRSGAGRTRLVMDAVLAAQRELAAGSAAVPSFRRFARGQPVPHGPTIVFAADGDDDVLALHRAARLSGAPVVVIVEREEPVDGSDVDITLGALGALPFGELVAALLDRPETALVESLRRSTGGMPGLLVRALAERWMAGADPRSGLAERPPPTGSVVDTGGAHELALAAALAGGAIDARTARRIAGRDARRDAETLLSRGLAERDAEGRLHLRDDVVDPIVAASSEDDRRRLAATLAGTLPAGPGRALARAVLGSPDAATEVAAAATRSRDEGAPEAAALLLRRARRFVDVDPLRVAHADALLAAGRTADALAALEGATSDGARWLRAEALRRAGRSSEARAALEALGETSPSYAPARASLARLALAAGTTVPDLDALAPREADAAFVDEARALVALSDGDPARALSVAALARAALDARTALPAFERARGAARLRAIEASARSAIGDAEGAHDAFAESVELAARAGEAHATAAFLVNLGIGRLELGLLGPALDALARGAERLVQVGRDGDAARALYNVANAALLAGDRTHARHAAEGALRETTRVGDDEARTLAEVVLADVDVGEGRPRAAERRLGELAQRSDAPLVAARLAIARVLVHDLAGARAALEQAPGPEAPIAARVEHDIALARVALASGDVAGARARSAAVADALGGGGGFELRLRALGLAVDVAEAAGDPASAEPELRAQRTLLDRALASLPSELHGPFRTLHARALAVRPATSMPTGTPDVTPHARALLAELRTTGVAERLVASARALSSAEHAVLAVRETDGALTIRAAHGPSGRVEPEALRISTSIVGRCLDRAERVASIDAGVDGGLDGAVSIHALALRSVVAVPVALGDRAAVLYVDDRLRPAAFGPGVVDALDTLAAFASIAFAHAARARKERRAQVMATRRERVLRASLDEKTREVALLAAERPAHVEVVAESPAMRGALALAARVAASDASLLLTGESGTGKEVVARFVHRTSARAAGPFVAESCAAIPEPLFESTLFGHVRGAFSGAVARRRGLFELAEGGTLFLDEIAEMPLAMQSKLLRALSAREIRPIGSDRTRPIDVRVVAATHRDLRALVARGAFREDLFYRIAVVEVPLPPLRERPADVLPLARAFVRAEAGERATIEPAAIDALGAYGWPGNVRELENEVRRALALDREALRASNLSPRVRGDAPVPDDLDVKRATDRLERQLVERALTRAGHNVTQAAKLLGLSRFGLQKMMARQRK